VTAIVIVMVLIVFVALVALSRFVSADDNPPRRRSGRQDPDEGGLDDLLR
jgi:hypothetical protein